ncbi:uncharacterized protein LOC124813953 [Hydra vulgaris]|uniref:uncharacterized protein LOC124813953 n=1 Tax=Hydra vulgaris TaxID=6087 RepID=UPI0032EA5080
MKTIFNKVRDEFPGYISHFRDAGIVDDRDFSEIIYKTLSELFPLKTQILLRAKLWKLIQTELKKVMHELNISDADFHENITSDTSVTGCGVPKRTPDLKVTKKLLLHSFWYPGALKI